MKEQIITFETSELAKEAGFDWEVNHAYVNLEPLEDFDGETAQQFWHAQNHNEKDHRFSAPTQATLQKNLRDEHIVDISVIPNWIRGKRYYHVGFTYVEDDAIEIWFSRDETKLQVKYEKYEVALEVGLQEALKKIIG